MPVLDRIVGHMDKDSVLNTRQMCRKLRVAGSKRLWSHVTLTNLPHKRQEKDKLQIYVNRYTFRTFFQDVYAGKLDHQLGWCKKLEVLFKEDDLVNLVSGSTVETVKNLNYVPIQNFFHWFLSTKAGELMSELDLVVLNINLGSSAFADAVRAFAWSLQRARVCVSYWIPGFAGIIAKDLIAPNMHEIELKCDLLNFDTKIFTADFSVPRKCQIFKLGLEDKLRFEHKLRIAPSRPKLDATVLQRWFRKCQSLHTLHMSYIDVINPDAIDWTPECFLRLNQPTSLVLEEVEFYPPKQAVIMKHVNLLDRINVQTRPLMELLAPHLISLSIAATRATEEQLHQLVHWFKFHKPTLQKVSIHKMKYASIDFILRALAEQKYKMVDIFDPIPDTELRFSDLAKSCAQFAVLKIHMKNISIESGASFLRNLYSTQPSHLSSIRVVDGPFTRQTLPKFVLVDHRQFQLLETKGRAARQSSINNRRVVVFEKTSQPASPAGSLSSSASAASTASYSTNSLNSKLAS